MGQTHLNGLNVSKELSKEQIYNYGNISFVINTEFRETGARTLGDVLLRLIKSDIEHADAL